MMDPCSVCCVLSQLLRPSGFGPKLTRIIKLGSETGHPDRLLPVVPVCMTLLLIARQNNIKKCKITATGGPA
jgi:hypothetical protein